MDVSRYRSRIKAIALWTILAWIAMVTLLIVASIWDMADSVLIGRVIWTASTLTGGILLACVTILGFACVQEDAERRRLADSGDASADRDGGGHLHDALARAKDTIDR